MLGAWLRAWVRNNILAGVEDACAELEGGSESGAVAAVERLRGRLALPAPAADGNGAAEPAVSRRRGKGGD